MARTWVYAVVDAAPGRRRDLRPCSRTSTRSSRLGDARERAGRGPGRADARRRGSSTTRHLASRSSAEWAAGRWSTRRAGAGACAGGGWRRRRPRWRGADPSSLDVPDFGLDDADGIIGLIVAIVAIVVLAAFVAFVALPLAILLVELLIFVVLAEAGIAGRLAFGRPWTLEAGWPTAAPCQDVVGRRLARQPRRAGRDRHRGRARSTRGAQRCCFVGRTRTSLSDTFGGWAEHVDDGVGDVRAALQLRTSPIRRRWASCARSRLCVPSARSPPRPARRP